jgi:putative SOS response-associated peptidase YedK
MMLINARAEGDHNTENNPNYSGAMGIILKPAFRNLIRQRRCIIPADAFYEGPEKEKLDRPYLVYPRNADGPFAFAGVWDTWRHPETGHSFSGFSIITSTANKVLQKIGHHRCPVILPIDAVSEWLHPQTPLSRITALLHAPPDDFFNAYPVWNGMKSAVRKGSDLLRPTGERVLPEYDYVFSETLNVEGMGQTTSRRLRNEGVQGELF